MSAFRPESVFFFLPVAPLCSCTLFCFSRRCHEFGSASKWLRPLRLWVRPRLPLATAFYLLLRETELPTTSFRPEALRNPFSQLIAPSQPAGQPERWWQVRRNERIILPSNALLVTWCRLTWNMQPGGLQWNRVGLSAPLIGQRFHLPPLSRSRPVTLANGRPECWSRSRLPRPSAAGSRGRSVFLEEMTLQWR